MFCYCAVSKTTVPRHLNLKTHLTDAGLLPKFSKTIGLSCPTEGSWTLTRTCPFKPPTARLYASTRPSVRLPPGHRCAVSSLSLPSGHHCASSSPNLRVGRRCAWSKRRTGGWGLTANLPGSIQHLVSSTRPHSTIWRNPRLLTWYQRILTMTCRRRLGRCTATTPTPTTRTLAHPVNKLFVFYSVYLYIARVHTHILLTHVYTGVGIHPTRTIVRPLGLNANTTGWYTRTHAPCTHIHTCVIYIHMRRTHTCAIHTRTHMRHINTHMRHTQIYSHTRSVPDRWEDSE